MKPYQTDFIRLALNAGVLRFGAFALKSGRTSPYFFNIGAIAGGAALARLADAYAAAFLDADLEAELLFGPAYKGIPLAATMATALAGRGRDLGFAYNRKEAKDHGEGGVLVGAEPRGKRVVIVDDVLTAGTALRQSVELLRAEGAEPVAAMIALDRQERGSGAASAVQFAAYDPRVDAVVAVAPFASLRRAAAYLAQTRIPWGRNWMTPQRVDEALAVASEEAQFDIDQADTRKAIQRTSAPVLLVHGTGDRVVQHQNSFDLHFSSAGNSELRIIPGATHNDLNTDKNGTVASLASEWFEMHLTAES